MKMKKIDSEEMLRKKWQHFLQIWESIPRQHEMIFGKEVSYAIVSKDKLSREYSETKEFLGVAIKKYPDNMFNEDLMIFVEDIVPREFQRYVVFHEWQEGRRRGNPIDIHQISLSDEIWLAKKELANSEFERFIQWLKSHNIIPKEWSEF